MNIARSMPVDLSQHMSLYQRPSVDQLLGMPSLTSYYSLPRFKSGSSTFEPHWARVARSSSPVTTPSYPASVGKPKKKKKRVVFADDKGLALTAVRFYSTDSPLVGTTNDVLPSIRTNTDSADQSKTIQFQLGFPQPSADYPSFIRSLSESIVRLESCKLMGRLLIGKVRVCNTNTSQEMKVQISITYDSWKSQEDILCSPVQPRGSHSEMKLLIFNVLLPSKHNLQDRVEFRVSFRTGSNETVLWDDNNGKNYRILVESVDLEDMIQRNTFISHSRYHSWPSKSAMALPQPTLPLTSSENIIKTLGWQEYTNSLSNKYLQPAPSMRKGSVDQLA